MKKDLRSSAVAHVCIVRLFRQFSVHGWQLHQCNTTRSVEATAASRGISSLAKQIAEKLGSNWLQHVAAIMILQSGPLHAHVDIACFQIWFVVIKCEKNVKDIMPVGLGQAQDVVTENGMQPTPEP